MNWCYIAIGKKEKQFTQMYCTYQRHAVARHARPYFMSSQLASVRAQEQHEQRATSNQKHTTRAANKCQLLTCVPASSGMECPLAELICALSE